jgi:hypothetical protein
MLGMARSIFLFPGIVDGQILATLSSRSSLEAVMQPDSCVVDATCTHDMLRRMAEHQEVAHRLKTVVARRQSSGSAAAPEQSKKHGLADVMLQRRGCSHGPVYTRAVLNMLYFHAVGCC